MQTKTLSFGEVLKRQGHKGTLKINSSHLRLSQIFTQWSDNHSQDYTLYLAQVTVQKSRSQHLGKSRQNSKGEMFDSWIERQAVQNKQNNQAYGSWIERQAVQNKQNNQAYGNQTEMRASNIFQGSVPSNIYRSFKECGQNNQKQPRRVIPVTPSQVEFISSKEYGQDSIEQSYQEEEQTNERNRLYTYTEPKENYFSRESARSRNNYPLQPKQNNPPKCRESQIQRLVKQTETIPEEVTDLAHRLVLDDKKKKESEDELLISIEDQKRLVVSESQDVEEKNIQKQKLKQQIGSFYQYSQPRHSAFTFAKRTAQLPKEQQKKTVVFAKQAEEANPQKEDGRSEVGYSFATGVELNPQGIPLLIIPENIATIPLIQQIASERQYSEGNSDMQRIYSKYKPETIKLSSEHIQNIESMYVQRATDNQKPQIVVNIPSNYYEGTNPSTLTVGILEPDPEGRARAQMLCLSESPRPNRQEDIINSTPKQIQLNFSERQYSNRLEQLTSTNRKPQIGASVKNTIKSISSPSSSLRPQRDIYLSNAEPDESPDKAILQNQEFITQHFQTLLVEQQGKVDTQVFEADKVIEKTVQIKPQIKIKHSPAQLHCGLTKVYSTNKKEDESKNKKVEPIETTDFDLVKEEVKSRFDVLPATAVPETKISGNKVVVKIGSTRSKEKGQCRIGTYAHTSKFTVNNVDKQGVVVVETKKQEEEGRTKKQEEEGEQFNFDF